MPSVSRVMVQVEILEDDGSTSTHEVQGVPKPGSREIQIVPDFRTQIRRSTRELILNEVVSVAVQMNLVIVADGTHRLFGVDQAGGTPVIVATESAQQALT